MELPGGLLHEGRLQCELSFKPITGALERIISESGLQSCSLAEQVTTILSNALDIVAGLPADEERVRLLSSGDREYLIHQLEAIIAPFPKWLTSSCQKCEELIQFQFIPGMLPVKLASKEFPMTSLLLSIGEVSVRVSTGKDEEAIAHASDAGAATALLLNNLLSRQGNSIDINSLTEKDRQLIDQVLDDMSPQPGHSASVSCPYCHHSQVIEIDTYGWITYETHGLDEDIHTLAFHYHWSEKEILALSRTRRKRYVQMIEKKLGRYQAEDFIKTTTAENRGVAL